MTGAQLLRRLLVEQRWAVVAGAASGVAWMVALAAVPAVVGRAVDAAVVDRDWSAATGWLSLLAAAATVQVVGGGARHWLACRLYYGTTAAVSGLLTDRLHDPRGGVDEPPGAVVSLATSDGPRIGAVADLCCRGTGAVAALGVTAAVMLALSPLLALAVLATVPVLLALAAPLLRPLERRTTAEQRARARVAAVTADTIGGLGVLHGLGAVGEAAARFRRCSDEARQSGVAAGRLVAAWEAVAVLIPGALLTVTLAVGGHLVSEGSLTVGELVGFLAYSQFVLTPVATLVEVGDVWARGLASARRVAAVLAQRHAVDDRATASPTPDPSAPAVELVEVRTHDGELDGCSFAVAPGQLVAVAADDDRSGRAVADVLARTADPVGGHVAVAGWPAPEWPLRELRARVVVTHGDGLLLDTTVRSNVVFGRPGAGADDVQEAMVSATVEDLADTAAGERGRALSGGQRQRVGVARALLADPPVLVLVDPTTAVDAHTEQAVAAGLAATRRRRAATLVITTSPAVLAVADHVVHLCGGRVAAVGRHAELLVSSTSYCALTMPTAASTPVA